MKLCSRSDKGERVPAGERAESAGGRQNKQKRDTQTDRHFIIIYIIIIKLGLFDTVNNVSTWALDSWGCQRISFI